MSGLNSEETGKCVGDNFGIVILVILSSMIIQDGTGRFGTA